MQTEMSSQHHADPQAILAQLGIPFDPSVVMWRVAAKSRDGKQGRVTPYADQRAYTDRLNQLVSPSGWTREYSVSSLSSLTRSRKTKSSRPARSLSPVSLRCTEWVCTAAVGKSGPMMITP